MVDFLYHLLGVCGEHNHPHLINMGFLAATIYTAIQYDTNTGMSARINMGFLAATIYTAIRVYQKYYSYE